MKNGKDEMLSMYGLTDGDSILTLLNDLGDEDEIKEYCWKVLKAYPDLKKENWSVGIEGGDYIYSFDGNYVFITDDVWSFNLVAKQPVLELLVQKIKELCLHNNR
ncbi:MAG: hypothetical protein ACN6O7_12590 [Sphingobacterium sp.]